MYRIKRLDFNVAYACNLSCKGCISLSDFDRKGVESLQDIEEQCKTWSKILDPSVISIFGGEPLLHPRIEKVLNLIREYWPTTQIRLITNGYLLRRYDPEIWFRFGGLEMQVSIHRQDHEHIITKEIKRIVECRTNWQTKRTLSGGHKQLELHNKDLSIYKSKFKDFVMIHPGEFSMGSPKNENGRSDDETQHRVRITKPFWISKFEVTNMEWNKNLPHFLMRGNLVFNLKTNILKKLCLTGNFDDGNYTIREYENQEDDSKAKATKRFFF